MSLLGWYKLDSDFQDYSGNNNHGTLIGTSPTFVQAKLGNGAQFTATTALITIPINPVQFQGSYSISCWLNITTAKNYGDILKYNWWTSSGDGLALSTNVNNINTNICINNTTHYAAIGSISLCVNTWANVITTFDGINLKLFINGTLIQSIVVPVLRTFSSNNPVYINGSGNINGILNDLRIYDHALSDKEIFNLSKGLVAHYTFDGCMSDATGYNTDAKFYNNSTNPSTPIFSDISKVGSNSLQVMGQTNNQWAQLPSSNFLNNVTDDMYTLSCWCNIINAPPQITTIGTREDRGMIFGKRGNHGGLTVMYDMKVGFLVWDGASTPIAIGSYNNNPSSTNTWIHLVGTVNKNTKTVKTYINGILVQTSILTVSALYDYGTSSFYIGAGTPVPIYNDNEWNYLLDLYIQDVRVYASELSASDVYNLYSTKASLDNSGNIYVYNNTEKYEATNTALSLTSSSVSSSIYSELGPTSGLIGYWPLKSDLKDYSGNNHHFSSSSTALFTGLLGKESCLNLDGTYQLYTFPTDTSLDSYDFSICGWININSLSTGAFGFIDLYITPTTRWRLFINTSHVFEFDYLPNEIGNIISGSLLTVNNWSFTTCIFNNTTSTMYLYVNGVLKSQAIVSGVSSGITNRIILGGASTPYLNGQLRNIRYYDRVLTSQEINTIYDLEHPNNNTRLKALSVEASISNAANTIFDQWYRFSHCGSTTSWNTTSSTSVSIGTGSKTFTIGLDATTNKVGISYGAYIYSASNPSCYMVGNIVSHSGTTMVVSISIVNGSGTFADWVVSVSNEYEKYVWKYDATLSRVICQSNTYGHVGFVSDKAFNNYTHEATLSSTNSDDDTIGLIIAFYKDLSWAPTDSWSTQITKEYTLAVVRDMGGNSSTGFRLVYNYNNINAWVINTKTVTIYKNGGTAPNLGWASAGIGVRVKVVRTDNIIEVWCTEPNTTSPYLTTTYMTLDLTSDSRLEKFQGYRPYGYCCLSQNGSTFSDITFTGTMCQVYPKNELKEVSL